MNLRLLVPCPSSIPPAAGVPDWPGGVVAGGVWSAPGPVPAQAALLLRPPGLPRMRTLPHPQRTDHRCGVRSLLPNHHGR